MLFLAARHIAVWFADAVSGAAIALRARSLEPGYVIGGDELFLTGRILFIPLVVFGVSVALFRFEQSAARFCDHFRACVLLYALAGVGVASDIQDLVSQSYMMCYACQPEWYTVVPPALLGNMVALHRRVGARVAA